MQPVPVAVAPFGIKKPNWTGPLNTIHGDRSFPTGIHIPEECLCDPWPYSVDYYGQTVYRSPFVELLLILAIHWKNLRESPLFSYVSGNSSELEVSSSSVVSVSSSSDANGWDNNWTQEQEHRHGWTSQEEALRASSTNPLMSPITSECELLEEPTFQSLQQPSLQTTPVPLEIEVQVERVQTTSPTIADILEEETQMSSIQIPIQPATITISPIPELAEELASSDSSEEMDGDFEEDSMSEDSESSNQDQDCARTIDGNIDISEKIFDILQIDPGAGVIAYGPHQSETRQNLEPDTPEQLRHTHYLYIYTIHTIQAKESLVYAEVGKPAVIFQNMPISPYNQLSAFPLPSSYRKILMEFEDYLNGNPAYPCGVPIPDSFFQTTEISAFETNNGRPIRLPQVEELISTLVGHLQHPLLFESPYPPELADIQQYMSPAYPLKFERDVFELLPPELPHIKYRRRPTSFANEDETPSYFKGCLPLENGKLFKTNQHAFYEPLLYLTYATEELIILHAASPRGPYGVPLNDNIDWHALVAPRSFTQIFGKDYTPAQLTKDICGFKSHNDWIPRIPYLLLCRRQLNSLIANFETFFRTFGFSGLKEAARRIDLNRVIDFYYSNFLTYNEAVYLIAIYDFFLRLHFTKLATSILHILHVPFTSGFDLQLVVDRALEHIEPSSAPDMSAYDWEDISWNKN